jgi:V/A-type H+-transporting ATPase subunit I
MIVRMSKIGIIGPKGQLQDTLSILRELGIFQIEPASFGFVEKGLEESIHAFYPDKRTVIERQFVEELLIKIDELGALLPKVILRKSYIEPGAVIDVIAGTVERRLAIARELKERLSELERERSELVRHLIFLNTLASLVGSAEAAPDLDFIGLTIRDPGMTESLREGLLNITGGRFELMTRSAEDGSLVGLITVEKEVSGKVKDTLSARLVPEFNFPPAFSGLTFPEKVAHASRRMNEISAEMERINSYM